MRPPESFMKNIIVGTAGHIDHGKTALVRALTGIDTDRLEEEKRRGISIDLGFAHMDSGGVRFGFVDVPGHERFVKNMLAGVGGIDLVMLVVAADEGVKPQTREHFEICRLLGIRHGMIVLTRADLADPRKLEQTRLEAAALVRGSFLEGAPAVAASAVTGQGLDEVRAALVEVALRVPERDAEGILRLPIDRAFTIQGFGTVATGTLAAGTLHAGQEVEVQPGGRRWRVRGLQVYGMPVETARAGQRTAVNLAGVEATELHRGLTLTRPGQWEATRAIDCRLELLAAAPALRHGTPVHFHAWTAETEAEVRLFEPGSPIGAGSSGYARLLLREAVLLAPGDRFILRRFSPVETIGGGVVLDPCPPLRMKKALVAARLKELASARLERRLALWADESPSGADAAGLAARAGVPVERVVERAAAAGLVVLRGERVRLAAKTRVTEAAAQLRKRLEAFHAENPLLPGMPRTAAGLEGGWLEAVLESSPEIVADGGLLRLADFRPQRREEETQAAERMERLAMEAGFEPPRLEDVLAASGLEPGRARTLLQLMLKEGVLVRVSPEFLMHRGALQRLKEIVSARKGQRFGVGEFKQWTGISRKYAIPLLEFLDRERVTRREGDRRLVL
jgi:selenocysteine-specific elongation factor